MRGTVADRRPSAGDVRRHEAGCRPGRRAARTAAGGRRVSVTVRDRPPIRITPRDITCPDSQSLLLACDRGAASTAGARRRSRRPPPSRPDADQERDGPHRHEGEAREHRPAAAERQDRADRQEPLGARGRAGHRRDGQVRDARHHRPALAHDGRRRQRGLALGDVDGAHSRRAQPDGHQHLPPARRRRHDDQRAARLGEHDRRTERRREAQVGARRRPRCCSPARCRGSSSPSART